MQLPLSHVLKTTGGPTGNLQHTFAYFCEAICEILAESVSTHPPWENNPSHRLKMELIGTLSHAASPSRTVL
jgi:hypothetical protein